jgi:hypothetical protein
MQLRVRGRTTTAPGVKLHVQLYQAANHRPVVPDALPAGLQTLEHQADRAHYQCRYLDHQPSIPPRAPDDATGGRPVGSVPASSASHARSGHVRCE